MNANRWLGWLTLFFTMFCAQARADMTTLTWEHEPGNQFDTLVVQGAKLTPDILSDSAKLRDFLAAHTVSGTVPCVGIPEQAFKGASVDWPVLQPGAAQYFEKITSMPGVRYQILHGQGWRGISHSYVACNTDTDPPKYSYDGIHFDTWTKVGKKVLAGISSGPGIIDVVFVSSKGSANFQEAFPLKPDIEKLIEQGRLIVHRHFVRDASEIGQ